MIYFEIVFILTISTSEAARVDCSMINFLLVYVCVCLFLVCRLNYVQY